MLRNRSRSRRPKCTKNRSIVTILGIWAGLNVVAYRSGQSTFLFAFILIFIFGGGIIHGGPRLDVVGASDFRDHWGIHIHVSVQFQSHFNMESAQMH